MRQDSGWMNSSTWREITEKIQGFTPENRAAKCFFIACSGKLCSLFVRVVCVFLKDEEGHDLWIDNGKAGP